MGGVVDSSTVFLLAADVRRNIYVLFTLLTLPIPTRSFAASTIAATGKIAKREAAIQAWNVTGEIAESLLCMKDTVGPLRVTPVSNPAQIGTMTKHREAS